MSSLLLNSGILHSGLPMATRSYQVSSSVVVREVARFWLNRALVVVLRPC